MFFEEIPKQSMGTGIYACCPPNLAGSAIWQSLKECLGYYSDAPEDANHQSSNRRFTFNICLLGVSLLPS